MKLINDLGGAYVKNMKETTKIMALIIGVILLVIVGYVVILMNRLNNFFIGKIVNLNIQEGSADYLEMLLEPENEKGLDKLILLNRNVVVQVIQYMRDNDVRSVSGKYDICNLLVGLLMPV